MGVDPHSDVPISLTDRSACFRDILGDLGRQRSTALVGRGIRIVSCYAEDSIPRLDGEGDRMRTLCISIAATIAVLGLGACSGTPVVEPDPPDLLGVVTAADSPETVDGGRLLGALMLTLADGSTLEVPRGVDYDGPRCVFVDESGDYGAVRQVSECVIHVGMTDDGVNWIRGFVIAPDGSVTPGFATGDLVSVNVGERYVVTQWGGTFPWRDDAPVIDCALSGEFEIDDPALVDHAAFLYRFDADGYLSELSCGYEG